MARHRLPTVLMRGGTSKGLFFHERDLPEAPDLRDRLLLSAMGSPDPFGRQLNGMGGGLSSVSKVIIVRPSHHPDADIEYLHGQIAVDRALIDYSANCGNLSTAVGAFAIDEGLFPAGNGTEQRVRLHNLNSGALIHAQIPIRDGRVEEDGDFVLPGVAGTGSRIALEYLNAGVPLLPTGQAREIITLPDGRPCQVTIADASLACVFVNAVDVGLDAGLSPDAIDANSDAMALLDFIRREAGLRLGMAASPDLVPLSTPKVAVIGPPAPYTALDGALTPADACDLLARVISMDKTHKAIPLTVAMCLAAAALSEGSVPGQWARSISGPEVRIGAASGVVPVGALLAGDRKNPTLLGTTAYATARRLMDGAVYAVG